MAAIYEDLLAFTPLTEEETADYALMLDAAQSERSFGREWPTHFTASYINHGRG